MAVNEEQIVGNYRILNLVGQGGMATVYRAYHARLNRYVALKMIHQQYLNDAQFIARFEREAQLVARLEHPNILPVYDYDEYEGKPYLVMKYIEGMSLKEALAEGPLELPDIVLVMKAISSALDFAHQQGVLHRDIKPSNIMLDQQITPYLADFGLARTVQDSGSSLSQGMLIGTPAYMSPEQATGKRELDARSDLYSLGVVLYELVVGRLPFDSDTTYSMLHDHVSTAPFMPTTFNPNLPPGVEGTLLRALAKDPEDRFPTATAMLTSLEDGLRQSAASPFDTQSRHSLLVSLEKVQDDKLVRYVGPSGSSSTQSDALKTPSKGSVPLAQTGVPVPGEVAARYPITEPAPPRRRVDTWLIAGLVGAVVLLAVLFVIRSMNQPVTQIVVSPTLPPSVSLEVGGNPPAGGNGSNEPPVSGPPVPGDVPGLPPIPNGIELYEIQPLTLEQAEAAVREDPENPATYLELAQAQLVSRSSRPSPEEIDQTLNEGVIYADPLRYNLSILSILHSNPSGMEFAYPLYNRVINAVAGEGAEIVAYVRESAGGHLYDVASHAGLVPPRLVPDLANMVADNDFDDLISLMMARLHLTNGDPDLAQEILDQIEAETPERRLVQADLLQGQGDLTGARAEWEALAEDQSAPNWVRVRAREMLAENP
jgi:tRNA A-37 threonylcarbamoyl transferase component Bud32